MGNLPTVEMISRREGQPEMRYDVTSREARTARRSATIEMTEERGKWGQLNDLESLLTTARLRDLYRNYSQAKTIINQIVTHVVGCGNRVIFSTADKDWNAAAADWYENEWARYCDGRDNRNLHDLNGLFLCSIIREHDCLVWFDRGGIVEEGRLFYWETDQICNLREKDFKAKIHTIARRVGWSGRADSLRQECGVIMARTGKPLGYVVHPGRGVTEVAWEKATILPHGPAQLIKKSMRLHQRRGVADMLTCAANLVDSYEMLEAELNAAKTAAKFAIKVKSSDAFELARARSESNTGVDTPITVESDTVSQPAQYRNFEKLSGGAIEYLMPEDDVEVLENKRPAAHMSEFIDAQSIYAGGSVGLPRFFSLMKADASFSAVRGEMNLGIATFEVLQKFLERYVLNWEVEEAISWASATGQIPPAPIGWNRKINYDHPVLQPLDEDKQTRSNERALKTGQKTLQDIHGPDWRDKVDQRAEERAYMIERGIDPDAAYGIAVVQAEPISDDDDNEPEDEDENQ